MSLVDAERRVLSGMRPSGLLHLGHYQGVLKNWVKLQHTYECFFCIVDLHALTTDYDDVGPLSQRVMDMAVDWLAAGVSPSSATLFIQSQVPEHAELHLLLSMICPLSWLERVPSYKEQQEQLHGKDLSTFGFLGYPLLQAADILLYRAGVVPVGSDQLAHIEFARDVARRFNHLYGREPGFEEKAEAAIIKLGKKTATLYNNLRKAYQEQGDAEALETARALLKDQQSITLGDKERLYGYLEGGGKILLVEPQAMLGESPKLLGLDGSKMSKSNNNAIFLRDSATAIEEKIPACRPTRRGCIAMTQAARQIARFGRCISCIPAMKPATGRSKAVAAPVLAVWNAKPPWSKRCSRSCNRCRHVRLTIRTIPIWCGRFLPMALIRPAPKHGRPLAKCAWPLA